MSAQLPAVGGNLPVRAPEPAGPPSGKATGFGELDLDLLTGPSVPPQSLGFGEIDLPPAPVSAKAVAPPAFDDALEADPFGEAAIPSQAPPAAPASAQNIVRSAGGGTSYGEVNLDSGSAPDLAVDAPPVHSRAPGADEGMEFGAIPQEAAPRAAAAAVAHPTARMPSLAPVRRRRWPLRLFGALLVVAVGGGSLSFVESLGPYGAYWISDQINAGRHQKLLSDSIAATRRELGRDTWPEAKRAFEALDASRGEAKRLPEFAAYVALDAYLTELRFGPAPQIRARGKVLLDELGADSQARFAHLARAAQAVVENRPGARAAVAEVANARASEIEARVLAAEVALRGADAKAAEAAWTRARELESSARTSFGLARAKLAAGDAEGASSAAKAALASSAGHVGARILLARVAARSSKREAEALGEIEALLKEPARASVDEVAAAETLLGDIHLERARVSLALAAYGRALKVRPNVAGALSGMGEALFQAGRFAEALARFEASIQADPGDLRAEVGVAKSKLSLERIEEATSSLAKLTAREPKSPLVALWYGRALEAAANLDRASAVYHAAIDSGASSPELIDVHVALATLQNQRGQSEEAQKTLAKARARLPNSPRVHRALGELALVQARPADAVVELERALALDADDLPARFALGVALRRSQKFEAATRELDQVAKADHEYPGLALERGLIFEATGHNDEALKAYRDAFAKAPNDLDLMMRVGCGAVAAGKLDEAEELLKKVLLQRPNSAESNHCLGRVLLERNRVPDAQRLLDRAIELDPNRAQFHLYAGRAANEAGNLVKADKELAAALALDNSLADAYWQRGVLRANQGAVRDAVIDLTEALKRNPARTEAHAALADAYYDLGREHDALGEWAKAVQGQPDNALWRFRYGKLLVTNHMNDAGRAELARAIEAAEKSESPPRWLWEAHHFMARALGERAEAAPHWEQFLRLGPRDSPYRREAIAALKRFGRPWSGN